MVSTAFSISSFFCLAVSLIGNWEQSKELSLRSVQIEELKLDNEHLIEDQNLNKEQLAQLKQEREEATQQQAQLSRDLKELRKDKESAEKDVAVLRESLRGKELNEANRVQLERDLAKANGKLEAQEEMIRKKEDQFDETQYHLRQLSMNLCGSFTPRGIVKLVNDWADVSPWTISILGNVFFTAVLALLWRLFMYPRVARQNRPEAIKTNEASREGTLAKTNLAVPVPVYDWWFFYLIRKLVVWGVAIFALTILPLHLRNFAGRQAGDVMEQARSSFCQGASWCTWGFDTILTPNAVLIAEGEAYVHAARGWKRVMMSQALAWAADWAMLTMIYFVAWPFRGNGQLALGGTAKKEGARGGKSRAVQGNQNASPNQT